MKRTILVFITLFIMPYVYSQGEEENKLKNYPDGINALVTFSPIPLVFYSEPRFQMGYIKKIKPRFWLGADLGLGLRKKLDDFNFSYVHEDYKLFEIRPEAYYNLQKNNKKLRHLLSVELFYIYHSAKIKDNYYYDINKQNIKVLFDEAKYQRIKYGLNCNYNYLIHFGKRVSLMKTIGLGIKHRHVGFSSLKNVKAVNDPYNEWIYLETINYRYFEGRHTSFNVHLDIKLVVKL